MKEKLLDYLACPICRGLFKLADPQVFKGEVESGQLVCKSCGRTFPIRRFIPRFTIHDQYVRSFSFEWLRHTVVQYGFESREAFFAKTGFDQQELEGKVVLDAGCGSGRFADVASRLGAEVVAFDLSYSVDAALSTIGFRPKVHLVQADVLRPPFKSGRFNFIFSIGVLHHTPDPEKAFLALSELLAPKGKISVWLYPQSSPARWDGKLRIVTSDMLRKVSTRSPVGLLHWLSHLSLPAYSMLRIPKVGRLIGIIEFSTHPDWRHRILDTFDWYGARYQSKHSYQEVSKWFKKAGLEETKTLKIPVSVTGVRSSIRAHS